MTTTAGRRKAIGAAVALLAILGGVAPAGAAPGAITEYNLSPGFNVPRDITTGRDGNMWFTELVGDRIGRITRSGVLTEFPLPPGDRGPFDINPGPLQLVWFTEIDANRIGRITCTGAVTEYMLPHPGSGPLTPRGVITELATATPASRPAGITAGPDGALWFTEHDASRIGRVTTSGVMTEFALPPRRAPHPARLAGARAVGGACTSTTFCRSTASSA